MIYTIIWLWAVGAPLMIALVGIFTEESKIDPPENFALYMGLTWPIAATIIFLGLLFPSIRRKFLR